MAECVDSDTSTSDEYFDPHCEPCYKAKRSYIKEYGFCHVCYQFLCADCHEKRHDGEGGNRHIVQRGLDMPTSLAEKPPKYVICDEHPSMLKDLFCCDDNVMICSFCVAHHNTCLVKSIDDVCNYIPTSDVDSLYEAIRSLEAQAKEIHLSIHYDLENMDKQKQTIINETQTVYDTVLSKINNMYIETKLLIESEFETKKSALQHRKKTMDSVLEKLKEILNEGQKVTGTYIGTKLFLQIQETVRDTNHISDDIRLINKFSRVRSFRFVQSELMRELISAVGDFGTVRTHLLDDKSIAEISNVYFPTSLYAKQPVLHDNKTVPNRNKKDGSLSSTTAAANLLKIKASKLDSYNLKLEDDNKEYFCTITDMAIIEDIRRLLAVDRRNCTVKLFSTEPKHFLSKGLKFYSCVQIPYEPWGIALMNSQEAVLSSCNDKLVFLDISEKQLTIKRMRQVDFGISGIACYNGKFAICCPDTNPPSIKLIDPSGKVYWSVSNDQVGKQLFHQPMNLCVHTKGNSVELIVSDRKNNALTRLKAETGYVAATSQLALKDPSGVASDMAGNIYVCYFWANKVSILSGDLSEERMLLSLQDGLGLLPNAILHDKTKNQLIISYSGNQDTVDYFKLSLIAD